MLRVGDRVKQINPRKPGYGRVGNVKSFLGGCIRITFDHPALNLEYDLSLEYYKPSDLRRVRKSG
jgi:hypothetical protein